MAINETTTGNDSVAITGTASAGERTIGVLGQGDSVGVRGVGKAWNGVEGISHSTIGGFGVYGANDLAGGVLGESRTGIGVYGKSESTTGGAGVVGENSQGAGVIGKSKSWVGVYGESETSSAVWGKSKEWVGVFGVCESTTTGAGVWGKGGRVAGYFEGDVEVTGDIQLTNADCAEDFNISGSELVEPGTVMVLGNEDMLTTSEYAYDKRVAGVLSGAGSYKPGILLDRQPREGNRSPVALLGKVFCKVDASYAAIEVGDLLTTSDTPGHAMKASDPVKAFGSVIGKALRPLTEGQGLIPILVALQ
jgi:hypothetical protein